MAGVEGAVQGARPAFVEQAIADAAADLAENASPGTARVHERLLPVTRAWDPDQRWAFAEEFADAVAAAYRDVKGCTILFARDDQSRLSLYHRAQLAREDGRYSLCDATLSIVRQILADDLRPTTDPPDVPSCRVCGCVDEFACEVGCSWAEANLCSWCARSHG